MKKDTNGFACMGDGKVKCADYTSLPALFVGF